MTIVAGIDYSMTSPAIAIYDTEKELSFDNLLMFNLSEKKKYQGVWGNIRIDPTPVWDCPEERFLKIAEWAIDILTENKVEEVVLEGYAMGSTKGLVFQIAEHASVLKQKLYAKGIPFTCPAPTSVKKAFAGSGNAKKPDMVEAFEKRFGVSITDILGCPRAKGSDNDIVDSVANLMMHGDVKCMK
ncbi:hypothetical protein [Ralstonia phage RSP15]|uniref:RuvC-like Holliday junction resolvase n=1 Tax=Ralstonia phage RSP15 TaxID=1785960 RepID=UPI00074D498F|nr:RuvC-like Holliday junction resolvase [Ralstonia phage RSP15]BAU40022.1 hypothetical protein [Ralstonia phage RSP15]